MNCRPRPELIRILPDSEERTEVLGKPYEKPDEYESDKQRHFAISIKRAKNNISPGIKTQRTSGDNPSKIADVVVREKVRVDDNRKERRHPGRRMIYDSQIEHTPRLYDIAPNRCVHKAREQWHAKQFGVGEIRVTPRLDAT